MEPPKEGNALVMHENVVVTPHLGASTVEAQVCGTAGLIMANATECLIVMVHNDPQQSTL